MSDEYIKALVELKFPRLWEPILTRLYEAEIREKSNERT